MDRGEQSESHYCLQRISGALRNPESVVRLRDDPYPRYFQIFMMTTTAEPGRKRPYDGDLRWRIVYQRIGMNFTYQRIARNLNISTSTAQKIFKRFETTGSIEPTSSKTKVHLHSLDQHTEIYLIGTVLENSSVYLDELCLMIHNTFNINVSPPTICRVLRRHGITRKKVRQVALQRCCALRGAFIAQALMKMWICSSRNITY